MRSCGILLPIFSLPGKYGIGSFGREAYQFIDYLEKMNQSYWQILPLGPTTYGDSPYQTYSTFAGGENYLDLDDLYNNKLVTKEELENEARPFAKVNYDELKITRSKLYYKASQRFFKNLPNDYEDFIKEESSWVIPYAKFRALKNFYHGKAFNEWDEQSKNGIISEVIKEKISDEVNMHLFIQYTFFKQWYRLKKYANEKNIKIIGDLPIYVSYDSSDVWQNPFDFDLDEKLKPTNVAGCPPDAFSSDGQVWGNPLYNYSKMAENSYDWWVKRIRHALKMFDVLRIDHFRGFESYFAIPSTDTTAKGGVWIKGPGYDIFNELIKYESNPQMIMEDLGYLTDDVSKLLRKTGYPGMRVLEFAFDDRKDNPYLPHNYIENAVVYTGTHDNMPLWGWIKTLNIAQINQIKNYFNLTSIKQIPDILINAALASIAKLAIIPLQDYLGLDESSRINTPSTVGNNWNYRLEFSLLTDDIINKVKELTVKYYRAQDKKQLN